MTQKRCKTATPKAAQQEKLVRRGEEQAFCLMALLAASLEEGLSSSYCRRRPQGVSGLLLLVHYPRSGTPTGHTALSVTCVLLGGSWHRSSYVRTFQDLPIHIRGGKWIADREFNSYVPLPCNGRKDRRCKNLESGIILFVILQLTLFSFPCQGRPPNSYRVRLYVVSDSDGARL